MASKNKMESALENLASRLKLGSLNLNDRDECYLMFDQKFHVRCAFLESEDECLLYSSVGKLEKNSADAYAKILGDNFFWVGTAGAKLFLEPGSGNSDNLAIAEHIPMSMFDGERLYERIEDFVNAVEYWSTEYPKLQQGGGTSSAANSLNAQNNMGMFQA
jgi:hypothetical protein